MFFRRYGDWQRAAEELEKLSKGDVDAAIVKLELALLYHKLARFRDADKYFNVALELDPSLFKPASVAMHAESTLRAWGCGNFSNAILIAQRTKTLEGDEIVESDAVARSHDVVAVASLCQQGVGGGMMEHLPG